MNQQDMNRGIAIAVIALLAMGAVYLIIRASSIDTFGGRSATDSPIQKAENDDFTSIPGIQSIPGGGTDTPTQ